MARFVIVGQKASASPDFLLADLPSTSGRLDVLCRSIRAALLTSHGVRDGSVVYLVLQGKGGPRSIKIVGGLTKFLRPDERSMAVLVKKVLEVEHREPSFHQIRFGLSVAAGGLDVVLGDLGAEGERWLLDRAGEDVRSAGLGRGEDVYFIGDHLGFDDAALALLSGYRRLSLGPVDVHAEDAVAIVWNEIDRATVTA